jgi:hypothetical protein
LARTTAEDVAGRGARSAPIAGAAMAQIVAETSPVRGECRLAFSLKA